MTRREHDREAERLRDQLAELEAEQAALEAELAIFHAEYARRVLSAFAEAARRTTDEAAAATPPAPGPAPTPDLKRAYREAAKRMHPDLAPDAEARGHAEAFMKRLNDAYRAGDADAIADLARQWAASPYGDGGAGPAPVALSRLEAAVQRAEQRLEALRRSELAQLLEETMTAAAAGRDHLADLRAAALAANLKGLSL